MLVLLERVNEAQRLAVREMRENPGDLGRHKKKRKNGMFDEAEGAADESSGTRRGGSDERASAHGTSKRSRHH